MKLKYIKKIQSLILIFLAGLIFYSLSFFIFSFEKKSSFNSVSQCNQRTVIDNNWKYIRPIFNDSSYSRGNNNLSSDDKGYVWHGYNFLVQDPNDNYMAIEIGNDENPYSFSSLEGQSISNNEKTVFSDINQNGIVGDEHFILEPYGFKSFDSFEGYAGAYSYIILEENGQNVVYMKLVPYGWDIDGHFDSYYNSEYKFSSTKNLYFNKINRIDNDDLGISNDEDIVEIHFNANNVPNNSIDKGNEDANLPILSIPNYVVTKTKLDYYKIYYWNINPELSDSERWKLNVYSDPEGNSEFTDYSIYKFMNGKYLPGSDGSGQVYTPSMFIKTNTNNLASNKNIYLTFLGYLPDFVNSTDTELIIYPNSIKIDDLFFTIPYYKVKQYYYYYEDLDYEDPDKGKYNYEFQNNEYWKIIYGERKSISEIKNDGFLFFTNFDESTTINSIHKGRFELEDIVPFGPFGWYFVFDQSINNSVKSDIVFYWGVQSLFTLSEFYNLDSNLDFSFINWYADPKNISNFNTISYSDALDYNSGFPVPMLIGNFENTLTSEVDGLNLNFQKITSLPFGIISKDSQKIDFSSLIFQVEENGQDKIYVNNPSAVSFDYNDPLFPNYSNIDSNISSSKYCFFDINPYIYMEDKGYQYKYEKNKYGITPLSLNDYFFINQKNDSNTNFFQTQIKSIPFMYIGVDDNLYAFGQNYDNQFSYSKDSSFETLEPISVNLIPQYMYIPVEKYSDYADGVSNAIITDSELGTTSINFALTNPNQSENLISDFSFIFQNEDRTQLIYSETLNIETDSVFNEFDGTYDITFNSPEEFIPTENYYLVGYKEDSRVNFFENSDSYYKWNEEEQPYFEYGAKPKIVVNATVDSNSITNTGFNIFVLFKKSLTETELNRWKFSAEVKSRSSNYEYVQKDLDSTYIGNYEDGTNIYEYEIAGLDPNSDIKNIYVYDTENKDNGIYVYENEVIRTKSLMNPYVENSFLISEESISNESFNFSVDIKTDPEYEIFNPDELKLYAKDSKTNQESELDVDFIESKTLKEGTVQYIFEAINLSPNVTYYSFSINPIYTGINDNDYKVFALDDSDFSITTTPSSVSPTKNIFLFSLMFILLLMLAIIIFFILKRKKAKLEKAKKLVKKNKQTNSNFVQDDSMMIRNESKININNSYTYSDPYLNHHSSFDKKNLKFTIYLPYNQKIDNSKLRDMIKIYHCLDGYLYLLRTEIICVYPEKIEVQIMDLSHSTIYAGLFYSLDGGKNLLISDETHKITQDEYNQDINIESAVLSHSFQNPINKMPNPNSLTKLVGVKNAKNIFETLAFKHFERDYNTKINPFDKRICLPMYLEVWFNWDIETAIKWSNLSEKEIITLKKFLNKF